MVDSSKTAPLELWYKRIARVSVGAVLFLIFVGGVVRSSGSGMGCPDWPKCFGLFVPPTTVEEIPASFFEIHPQFESKSFNAFQTWTEYVNRLVGASIGLLMLITTMFSLTFFRKDIRIFLLSFGALLLTGFEGWLGKLVVDRNLAGGMVTLHLLVALVIVALLILANSLVDRRSLREKQSEKPITKRVLWLGHFSIALILGQILIGTQVRETVDIASKSLGELQRSGWLHGSLVYSIHKVMWLAMTGVVAIWVREVFDRRKSSLLVRRLTFVLVGCIVAEISFGILLASFDLPAVIQPLHMLFANLIFAAAFAIWVQVVGANINNENALVGVESINAN